MRDIKIVLDTSSVFPKSYSNFINIEVLNLIKKSPSYQQLRLAWYLPEIVLLERRYQIREDAKKNRTQWIDFEKFLGHAAILSDNELNSKVQENLDQNVRDLNLLVIRLDANQVNWIALINDATNRSKPFSDGEHEDGWRDKLISETLIQFSRELQSNANDALLVFVTKDKLFRDYMKSRQAELQNMRFYETMSEVEELLNIQNEQLDEGVIKLLRTKVDQYFLQRLADKVIREIREKYKGELAEHPKGYDRENIEFQAEKAEFQSSEDTRYHWVSRILVNAIGTGYVLDEPQHSTYRGMRSGARISIHPDYDYPPEPTPIYIKGQSVFKVIWSINLEPDESLTDASVDSISFEETIWGKP